MSDIGFNEAFRSDEFVVEIEGIENPGIIRVSGLSDGEVVAIDQPNNRQNITPKVSARNVSHDDLVLVRHVDGGAGDEAFRKWFTTSFAADGTGRGSQHRRNGSVVKRHFGEEVMRFAFEGAWIKSSRFSDLDAASTELMTQTLVLAVERMYRV